MLLRRRSDLRLARQERSSRKARGGDEGSADALPSSTHIGFAQVALMKVLQRARYPEREAWLEQFKAIETRTDAELFTVEAKLLIRHDIDFKRPRRTGRARAGRS